MRARGFTLVEVMVALAIVAIALPALLVALYQQVDDTGYLRDKTLAEMVAANQLAQMRLVVASTRSLTAGKDNGTVKLADRDWYWWVETTSTDQANFFRIEIDVALQEEQREHPLYTLTTYMSGDLQVDNTAVNPNDPNDPNNPNTSTDPNNPTDPNQPGNPGNTPSIVNPDTGELGGPSGGQ